MPPLPAIIAAAGAAGAVGAPIVSGVQSAQAAGQQAKAMQSQADTANRLADETRAEKAKLEADAAANTKKLAEAPGIAAEEARKEDMRRRAKQTKTLLSGSLGDTTNTPGMGKTLLGG